MEENVTQAILDLIKQHPEIQLFMLFGSRARGDAVESSDWDFAYIAKNGFDQLSFFADLTLLLKTDKVDLVNLAKVTGLLRFRVAKDGKMLYQSQTGEYEKFWLQAVHFWCDAGPIIRSEYEALLRRIA